MFEILACTGRDAARWQSLFDRLPPDYRDVFFTPAYARVQEALGQGRCFAAVYVWDEFFVLQPFLRQGLELTSFYGGGGPVSNLAGKADYRLWLWFDEAFAQWRQGHKITGEYVRLHPLFAQMQRRMLRESTLRVEHLREAVNVRIDVDNQALLKSFSRNRQRGVAEALRARPTVELTRDTSLFAEYYRESMERLKAKDTWRYKDSVWETYQHELRDYASFLIIPQFKSALLVLHGYGRAYAHFIAGSGNHDLLYYESMKFCRDVGCRTYFLGGGTTSDADDSLLAYKSGFSSIRVPVSHYKREFSECVNADGLAAQPA